MNSKETTLATLQAMVAWQLGNGIELRILEEAIEIVQNNLYDENEVAA